MAIATTAPLGTAAAYEVPTMLPGTVPPGATVATSSYIPAPQTGTVRQLPVSGVMSVDMMGGSSIPIGLPTISMPSAEVTAPPRLTSGMPDPSSVAKQREGYLRQLEEQERQAIAVLEQQRAQQVGLLRAAGDQQKKKYCLEVNQQVAQNDIVLDQQHSEQMMVLNQQYSQQRGVLENQANALIMEFQQKKAQEDMLLQQYKLQVDQYNQQKTYNEEMVRLQKQNDQVDAALKAAYATSYMPPPIAGVRTYNPTVTALNVQPLPASVVV